MNQKAASKRAWEITVDSNWIMTVGMVALLIFFGWQLIGEARDLVFGNLTEQVLFTHVIDKIGRVILVVYCLLFAFSFRALHVRVAFILLGTATALRFSLSYLHLSPAVFHFAAVGGSIADQIALTIILFAIVQWFKSVVRWIPPNKSGEAKS
jgi:hypothetical protein